MKHHPLIERGLKGMIKQGQKCYSNHAKSCRLRNDGMSCFVGQLINDEFYYTALERGANPKAFMDVRLAIQKSNPDLNIDISKRDEPIWSALQDLQKVHDQYGVEQHGDFVNYMREEADRTQRKYFADSGD